MPVDLRPVDLRRAVLALLLASPGPVPVRRVVDSLVHELGDGAVTAKQVADMLRYQVRHGRVRRVDRGVYEAVPGALSRSTAWRCVNWRREHERWSGGSAR
ncbi:MAG TPA: hypothetical protein VFZ79_20820 [Acidimicrobiales bacterium]